MTITLSTIITLFVLFFIALFGLLFNRRDILIILVCVEILLLSCGLLNISFSLYFGNMIGQLFALFILTVAAAESSVGLGIFIQYYRVKGDVSLESSTLLRG